MVSTTAPTRTSSSLTDPAWRPATPADAHLLLALEREANLVGLAHVFGDLPFPEDAVLSRWVLVLDDPEVVVDVVDDPDGADGSGGLIACAAHDPESLRHLAVHPASWGLGLGEAGVRRAVEAGATRLWVLELNHRARALYERLGWRPTGMTQECPWPPHPTELSYALPRIAP